MKDSGKASRRLYPLDLFLLFLIALSLISLAFRFFDKKKESDWRESAMLLVKIERLHESTTLADHRLMAANNTIDRLEAANITLQHDLDVCSKRPMQSVVAVDEILFFAIGEADIDIYAQATLDSYIAAVKDTNAKMTLTGYADRETGSAQRNEELSKLRAEAVKSYLVGAGISADRITVKWVGDTESAFDTSRGAAVNRCVVIE